MPTNTVTVRWFDGYMEDFPATEVRFGAYIIWMRLTNGRERIIPLTQVRWFSQSIESHQAISMTEPAPKTQIGFASSPENENTGGH